MWFNMPKMLNEMTLSTLLFIYLFIYLNLLFFIFYKQLKMALTENEPSNINIAKQKTALSSKIQKYKAKMLFLFFCCCCCF